MAGALFRATAAAAARDHLRDQSAVPRRCPSPVSRRRGPRSAGQPDRGRSRGQGSDGHLAIVGAHSTNGVAAIHSSLLRATTVRDLAEIFPERLNNKTNGVTPRRWLLMANPGLSRVIADAIGQGWTTDGGE